MTKQRASMLPSKLFEDIRTLRAIYSEFSVLFIAYMYDASRNRFSATATRLASLRLRGLVNPHPAAFVAIHSGKVMPASDTRTIRLDDPIRHRMAYQECGGHTWHIPVLLTVNGNLYRAPGSKELNNTEKFVLVSTGVEEAAVNNYGDLIALKKDRTVELYIDEMDKRLSENVAAEVAEHRNALSSGKCSAIVACDSHFAALIDHRVITFGDVDLDEVHPDVKILMQSGEVSKLLAYDTGFVLLTSNGVAGCIPTNSFAEFVTMPNVVDLLYCGNNGSDIVAVKADSTVVNLASKDIYPEGSVWAI